MKGKADFNKKILTPRAPVSEKNNVVDGTVNVGLEFEKKQCMT